MECTSSSGSGLEPVSSPTARLSRVWRLVAPHHRPEAVHRHEPHPVAGREGAADRRALRRAVDQSVADDRADVATVRAEDPLAADTPDLVAGASKDAVTVDA